MIRCAEDTPDEGAMLFCARAIALPCASHGPSHGRHTALILALGVTFTAIKGEYRYRRSTLICAGTFRRYCRRRCRGRLRMNDLIATSLHEVPLLTLYFGRIGRCPHIFWPVKQAPRFRSPSYIQASAKRRFGPFIFISRRG